ncbi:helicase-related protein [Micromonosporaceae bacterium DT194]|uniref:helicase-related protein n=1 Tax=Melissospora conviva TaxID=3388432 RepID=UPI003C27FA32
MSGVDARRLMEAAVRRELFGPPEDERPRGKPLDICSSAISFERREDSWGLWHDAATGQEVLTESDPLRRYGIGVLFSGASARTSAGSHPTADEQNRDELSGVIGIGRSSGVVAEPVVGVETPDASSPHQGSDADDFDLTDANSFKPSAMAISFQCDVAVSGGLTIRVAGAYYDRIAVTWPGLSRPRTWWVRRPFEISGAVADAVVANELNRLKLVELSPTDELRVTPAVQVFSRRLPGEAATSTARLVTVALRNPAVGSGPSSALFQMGLCVEPQGGLMVTPYPDTGQDEPDEEEESIDLLYRNQRTFAIGHGCAANWAAGPGDRATAVWADPLPAYEVPSLTPDVYVSDGNGSRRRLAISMQELASGSDAGSEQIQALLNLYEGWILTREGEIDSLVERFRPAARRHMHLCREALDRMRHGWHLATSDPIAIRSFRLMNHAMLIQQIRSNFGRREIARSATGHLSVAGAHPELNFAEAQRQGRGNWRPFQIAFLLASLPELIDKALATRRLVDLIFFPTGGGKTEAYLGASAISLLARRLRDPEDAGTDTLMRYTLRLLTAQQFIRAATLVCVLEDIRSECEKELGSKPFGIGVWLGGASTPNNWKQAVQNLRRLRHDVSAQNQFLLLRCPWCGAEMGPKPKPQGGQDVIGYDEVGKKVVLRCLDQLCRFGGRKGLPIHVVDEDIYQARPSIVIGTVDKFAMMAWRPEVRALFGVNRDGERVVSPPNLIVQDELHLISGPLGSMVGLYEPVVDDLCTDRRGVHPIPAKIIASTATARRYESQIQALYGRTRVALFPPHGLEEGHSFFAEPATLADGAPAPGRRYIGILSAGLGSTQSVQVRVAAATLQAANDIDEEDRDGYWTNLNFLNSLRELGNTVSLIQSDIPDFLTGLRRREGITALRWPRNTMELTSRRRSDDIPKAIEQLQLRHDDVGSVDICLASNIIEVGVDIDRLALMTIVGQPKTTAQYIQVSGRVGRRPDRSPGLVLTIYGAAKPRDRSHYERFRTYHQRLYAQVEPTSVTPFATPVLRRALHAVLVSHIRQTSDVNLCVYPFPEYEYERAVELLRERARLADSGELRSFERLQRKRAAEWDRWERTDWSANVNDGDPKQGLMRYAGTLPDLSGLATIWDVPTSMRNVDAECRLQISVAYAHDDVATDGEIDK